MARARLLKPGFFQNEDLAELPFEGRLLFAGLWILADREGRLEDRPKRIKAALFPWDSVAIDDLLAGLAERGFITRYQAEAVAVIQITKFLEHQKPHKREQESKLPQRHDLGPAVSGSRPAVSISISVPKRVDECSEATSLPPVLTFPCAGDPASWGLTRGHIDQWAEAYDVDVEGECRKALAWVRANMGRKKTAHGMERFLVNWLGKAQNEQRSGSERRQGDRRRLFTEPTHHEPWECPHDPRCTGGRSQCAMRSQVDAMKADRRQSA